MTTYMKCIHKVSKKERNMEKKKKMDRNFSLKFCKVYKEAKIRPVF